MACIDGYVLAVTAANKERSIEEARKAWTSFRKHGADVSSMPFDGTRTIRGGYSPILHETA